MRMTTLAERLKNEDYRYWIKSALCLQYTKDGLIQFATEKSKDLHTNVLQRCHNPSPTGICSGVRIDSRRGVINCCGVCNVYLVQLKQLSTGNLNLANSNITELPLHPWQMAKLLMNEGQDRSNIDAGQTDLAGILNFIDHYTLAKADIQNVNRIQEVRNIRNRIMHPVEMKVTSDEFTNKIIPAVIGLLEEKEVFKNNPCAKEAVDKIKEVAASDFHITKESESQVLKNVITDVITNNRYLESKLNDMGALVIKRVDEVLQTLKQKVNSDAELRARDNQETKDNIEQLGSNLAKCISEIEDVSAKVDFMFLEDKTKFPEICPKCGSGIKIEDQEGCENQHPMLRDTGCVEYVSSCELWVCCMKLYPWIKAELGKKPTICIASELLGQDNVDSMKTSQRCIAVDELLKHVLKDGKLLLVSFLEQLEFHCQPSNALRKKLEAVWPTKQEITETDKQIAEEKDLLPYIIKQLVPLKDYILHSVSMEIINVIFQSINFYLQPMEGSSLERMADVCSTKYIEELLMIIFPSKNILSFFSNKNRLRVTIFSKPHHTSNSEGKEMAVLKLEVTTTDSICTQDAKTLKANPIKRNMDLFCEELEINHDLLSSLKTKGVVQDDIEEKLQHIYSREAAIRCLMESISQPEFGYSVLKDYSKDFHPYLYQELEKIVKDEAARKLLFQCEAWTVPKNKEIIQDIFTKTFLTIRTSDQYDWVTEIISGSFNIDDTHMMVQTVSKTAEGEIQSTADTGEREPFTRIKTADEEMQTTPDTAERESLAFRSATKFKDIPDKIITYMRMTTLPERLQNENYRHWIKSALCLQYTKEGLVPFAIEKSQELHTNVLKRCGNPSPKGICSSVYIIYRRGVIKCCGHCERYLYALRQLSTGKLNLINSEITDLPLQHWQMAKLLMNEGQDVASTDAGKADIAGILNFIDHYILAKADIQDVTRIQEVRNIHNRIMHSAEMVTSDDFTNKIIPALIGLLEEKKVFENNPCAKEAVDKIKKVAASDFYITKESEFQVLENHITDVITNVRNLQNKLSVMEEHGSRDFKTEIKRVSELLQTLKQNVNSDAELRARYNRETKDNFEQLGSDLAKCISEIEDMSVTADFMLLDDKTKYREVCPKCGSGIKILAQETCGNQDPMLRDTGCVEYKNLSELWVCCIKLYPWMKAELDKKLTICIASELLCQDNVDSMKNCKRFMAVDELLKHVLIDRDLLLLSFLKHLELHCEPSNALRKKLEAVWPTKQEMTETDRQITVEKDLYPYIINRLAQVRDILIRSFWMAIHNIFFRSIVFHLQPIAEKSWKLMADKCSAGHFTEILGIMFPSENVLRFFSNKKNRLRVTIFSTPHRKSDIEGNEMAVLKLELTTTDSFCTQDAKTFGKNPIKCNIDLFCEELGINHDLLSSLKSNCVVQDDIEMKLKHIYSREAAIRCLLESISQPEIGYSVLKGYSKEFYPYLYQELQKTEKDEDARKLLFQCEAWTVPKTKETFLTKGTHDQYDWVTENLTCCFNKDDTHKMVQTIPKTADREMQRTPDTAERKSFTRMETADGDMQTTPYTTERKPFEMIEATDI